MIYLTVGTQLEFPRLVSSVDEWARGKDENIIAQIGPDMCTYENMDTIDFVPPEQANSYFKQSELVIAHAGMGSIITACELQKNIIILPREFGLNEHRNNHQVATARKFSSLSNVHVAMDVNELHTLLDGFRDIECRFNDSNDSRLEGFISRLENSIFT